MAWYPQAAPGRSYEGLSLATGAADCSARLWSESGKLLHTLAGHTDRCDANRSSAGVPWDILDGPRRLLKVLAVGRGMHTYEQRSSCCTRLLLWANKRHAHGLRVGGIVRLGRVAFHPMGHYLGTASYDQTWRLWDIATGDCILEQVQNARREQQSFSAVCFSCPPVESLRRQACWGCQCSVWRLRLFLGMGLCS